MLYDPIHDYDEVGRTLLKAANYIDEHGQCKGRLQDANGAVCAYGALHATLFGKADISPDEWDIILQNTPEQHRLESLCSMALLNETETLLSVWNDASSRTKDEVTDMFRRAAEKHKIISI